MFFIQRWNSSGNLVNLFDYVTKSDVKEGTLVDVLSFAKEVNLASLESDEDKLDIDKLKTLLANLNNLNSK